MMCVSVMALCNQPEAFTSDIGDDQSRYLFLLYYIVLCLYVYALNMYESQK